MKEFYLIISIVLLFWSTGLSQSASNCTITSAQFISSQEELDDLIDDLIGNVRGRITCPDDDGDDDRRGPFDCNECAFDDDDDGDCLDDDDDDDDRRGNDDDDDDDDDGSNDRDDDDDHDDDDDNQEVTSPESTVCDTIVFTGNVFLGPANEDAGNQEDPITDLRRLRGRTIIFEQNLTVRNTELEDLRGFLGVIEIGGLLRIVRNEELKNVDCLRNVTTFGGELIIRLNSELESLRGLTQLQDISRLVIRGNNDLGQCSIGPICRFLRGLSGTDLTDPAIIDIFNNGNNLDGDDDDDDGCQQCNSVQRVLEACIDFSFPVELTTFTGRPTLKSVILNWTTETETDNEGFIPQRSGDGLTWVDLGFVAGRGDHVGTLDYLFNDRTAPVGTSYYRLKQMDFEGTFSLSDVVTVNFGGTSEEELRLFPNPVTQTLNLSLSIPEEEVTIEVYNSLGQLVATKQLLSDTGLFVGELAPGAYLARVRVGVEELGRIARFQKL